MTASWQESYDKPRQCIKKQRHHFVDKAVYSQVCGLSRSHVQMWELDNKEGRALKNWCFWTVVLEKTLESSWTARRSNQSILKEISPGCSLEGLILRLKLQYFGQLMRRINSLEKTLMLGGIGGRRRRGWPRMRWLDGITDLMDMSLRRLRELEQGGLACCDSWDHKESDTTEWLNWLNCSNSSSQRRNETLAPLPYEQLKCNSLYVRVW